VAVGPNSGNSQYAQNVAVGSFAGGTRQGYQSIAIGANAGTYQLNSDIAIGAGAGASQNSNSVAIGNGAAGGNSQGGNAIALGWNAGYRNQGTGSIVIGPYAGNTGVGKYSVNIGNAVSGVDNSVVLGGGPTGFTGQNAGFYVNPVRLNPTITDPSSFVFYNGTTFEMYAVSSSVAKTFVINHPLDNTKYLVHGCLEGPEAGVYYRGEGVIDRGQKTVTIVLPDYVESIASNFTVQVTPIYDEDAATYPALTPFSAGRVKNNKFVVHGPAGAFFWQVHGERLRIEVEPDRRDLVVRGDGPYKWI
jgi:hypothetical protein